MKKIMTFLRASFLATLLAGLVWFQFAQDGSAWAIQQRIGDVFDARPTVSVLIVGNSRTFVNDMPNMVRALAAEPRSPVNVEVESSTAGGAAFQDHWSKPRTRRLLAAGWDDVVLQGESGAQSSREQNELFQTYGRKLAATARLNARRPLLLVNWAYDPSEYHDFPSYNREQHLAWLGGIHRRLASDAALDRIDLAGVWESVRVANPSIRLTSDGNHPTVAGSYLYALAVYTCVTGEPVVHLDYVPAGLDAPTAGTLRKAVDDYRVCI